MSSTSSNTEFMPVNIAVLTVSDTRTEATDTSGNLLVDRLLSAGHRLAGKSILADNLYRIRAQVAHWIAEPEVQVVIVTGGTGLTDRDRTPEAVRPLLDKEIEGFGEVFRSVSYHDIKTSTVQSRAVGGIANGTFVFCIPGSTNACRTAWDEIFCAQLDSRTQPCNVVQLFARLQREP